LNRMKPFFGKEKYALLLFSVLIKSQMGKRTTIKLLVHGYIHAILFRRHQFRYPEIYSFYFAA